MKAYCHYAVQVIETTYVCRGSPKLYSLWNSPVDLRTVIFSQSNLPYSGVVRIWGNEKCVSHFKLCEGRAGIQKQEKKTVLNQSIKMHQRAVHKFLSSILSGLTFKTSTSTTQTTTFDKPKTSALQEMFKRTITPEYIGNHPSRIFAGQQDP